MWQLIVTPDKIDVAATEKTDDLPLTSQRPYYRPHMPQIKVIICRIYAFFKKNVSIFGLFATRGGWKPQRRSFSFLSCEVSWLLLVVLTSQFFHKQNFTLSVKPRIFPAKDLQIRFFSTSNILSAHNYTVIHYRANPYCVKGHRQVQTGPDMPFMKIGMITSCTCLLAGIQPQESVTDLFFPWRESNFCY